LKPTSINEHTIDEVKQFTPFGGSGMKLGGKRTAQRSHVVNIVKFKVKLAQMKASLQLWSCRLVNYILVMHFNNQGYPVIPLAAHENQSNEIETFTGAYQKLRKTKKK
jgi:hypothetical protein